MNLRPDEINKLIKEQIRNYEGRLETSQFGTVVQVGDGIARVYGLRSCMANELLEFDDDYPEVEIHHRHVSHLYALHPARLITVDETPELAKACRRTLERRGDNGTGWSLGWKINFWARLFDGDLSKVPTQALTVGVGTVMDAKEVMILVFGHKKANALKEGIEGAYSHKCTLSAIQAHPRGIIVADELAVGELKVNTYRYFKDIEKKNL